MTADYRPFYLSSMNYKPPSNGAKNPSQYLTSSSWLPKDYIHKSLHKSGVRDLCIDNYIRQLSCSIS